jgi:hypothetical protein
MKKLLVVLAFLPTVASAGFFSGNDLLAKMNSTDYMDRAQAIGYVQGAFDAGQSIFHCAPDSTGVTAGQVQDIVRQHLERNPSTRNYSADVLINTALRKVWPCASKGKGA